MIREAEELKNKLDVTVINRDQLNKILLERINFAFDSLYFRYAMAIKELGEYKEREALKGTYRNFEVISMGPPSSGGISLIYLLNILENYAIRLR